MVVKPLPWSEVCTLINHIKTLMLDTDKKGLLVNFFIVGRDILLISYTGRGGGGAISRKKTSHCGSFVHLGCYSLNMDGNNLHIVPP